MSLADNVRRHKGPLHTNPDKFENATFFLSGFCLSLQAETMISNTENALQSG